MCLSTPVSLSNIGRVCSVDCTQIPVNKCPRHCRKWNEAPVSKPATNKDFFVKKKKKPEIIKSPCLCKPVQASISLGKLDFTSDLDFFLLKEQQVT